MNKYLDRSPEVENALEEGRPVVALESTIISHGMAVEKFADKDLHAFTRELASDQGKPGGGSAIALVGALAASLGLMVAGLTDGKPRYARYDADIKKCLKDLETLRVYLVHLVDEDILAFAPLAKYFAMVLPASSLVLVVPLMRVLVLPSMTEWLWPSMNRSMPDTALMTSRD